MQNINDINAAVAAHVARHIAAGLTPLEALRQVCGAELVDTMISTLYDRLTSDTNTFTGVVYDRTGRAISVSVPEDEEEIR